LKMRSETNCDGVMIGRAALTNPWIFKQILDMEKSGSFMNPSPEDRHRLIMEHYALLVEYLGETRAIRIIRGALLLYTKRMPNRGLLKDVISEIDGGDRLVSILDGYFGFQREEMPCEG